MILVIAFNFVNDIKNITANFQQHDISYFVKLMSIFIFLERYMFMLQIEIICRLVITKALHILFQNSYTFSPRYCTS